MPYPEVGFHHVDVFAPRAYTGNSLAVFVDPPPLTDGQLLAVTQELRHFETVFVSRDGGTAATARVFDLVEELDFAGHPVLGAAAVLHGLAGAGDRPVTWELRLRSGPVRVTTRRLPSGTVGATLEPAPPRLLGTPPAADRDAVAAAYGLAPDDLDPALPPEVWTAGLRYLVVPVRAGVLGRARVAHPDLAGFLAERGAQFGYLLDAATPEGRHWTNDGIVEDVATGSAAACVAAYLLHHDRAAPGRPVTLSQGRFTGRPSGIGITGYGAPGAVTRVTVTGEVATVATGTLHALPEPGDRP
jgi:PhzF family phenazine biosynthesis protein